MSLTVAPRPVREMHCLEFVMVWRELTKEQLPLRDVCYVSLPVGERLMGHEQVQDRELQAGVLVAHV